MKIKLALFGALAFFLTSHRAVAQQLQLAIPMLYEVKDKTLKELRLTSAQEEQLKSYREERLRQKNAYTKAKSDRLELMKLVSDVHAPEGQLADRFKSFNASMVELGNARLTSFLALRRVLTADQLKTVLTPAVKSPKVASLPPIPQTAAVIRR